jgi:hypothetical protein
MSYRNNEARNARERQRRLDETLEEKEARRFKQRTSWAAQSASNAWRRRNPDYWIKRKYGVSQEEKEQRFLSQGSCCANPGCRTPVSGAYAFHIDHDHKTKQIRGILCRGCNIALGHLQDDPKRAAGLAKYLRQFALGR